jgi:hypothetical protein
MRSSFRQLISCHSAVVFKLVLDICTHYLRFYLPNHRENVSISLELPIALASFSISPPRCIRLEPTQFLESNEGLIRSE